MTGHATHEPKTAILLRYEELQVHLEATKDRLNQAAMQLETLTKILLSRNLAPDEVLKRPWLDELIFSQLIADVLDAERRLSEARATAADLGIPLPTSLK